MNKKWLSRILLAAVMLNLVSFTAPTTYAATGDLDNDGVLDRLELNGYQYSPIDGFTETSSAAIIFKSDPNNFSTTGDPYGDGAKVSGLNMDATVGDKARNPLVAASPDIQVDLSGFEIVPIQTIQDSNGRQLQTQLAVATQTTDTTMHGWNAAVKQGGAFKIGTTGIEKTFTYEVSAGYTGSQQIANAYTKTNTDTSSLNWNTATTTDTSRAAKLRLNIAYKNQGTATAKMVTPRFNLKIGNKLIATIQPAASSTPTILTTSKDPSQQTFDAVVDKTSANNDIVLSMDELRAVMIGYPIEIEPVEWSGKVVRWDSTNNYWADVSDWNTYRSQITARTAKVMVKRQNGAIENYNMAAKQSYYDPHLKIGEILNTVVGTPELRGDMVYYNQMPLDSTWYFMSSNPNFIDEVNALTESGKGILDYQLKQGEALTISEPLKNPDPEIKFAQFSTDYKKVTASILSGDSVITNAKFTMRYNNNPLEINLTKDSSGIWYTNVENLPGKPDFAAAPPVLTVVNANGRTTSLEIKDTNKDGLSFTPLRTPVKLLTSQSTVNDVDGITNINFANQFPNAKALVVQVKSDRWSAENINVTFNDRIKVALGTGDTRKHKYKVNLTLNNGTQKSYTGNEDIDYDSSLSTPGANSHGATKEWDSMNDEIKTAQFIADPGYVLYLYEHGDWQGAEVKVLPGESYTYPTPNASSYQVVYEGLNALATADYNEKCSYATAEYKHSPTGQLIGSTGQITDTFEINNFEQHGMYPDTLTTVYAKGKKPSIFATSPAPNFERGIKRFFLDPVGAANGIRPETQNANWKNDDGVDSYKLKAVTYQSRFIGATNSPVTTKTVIIPVDSSISSNLDIKWDIRNNNTHMPVSRNLNGEPTNASIEVSVIGTFEQNVGSDFTQFVSEPYVINGTSNAINRKFYTGKADAEAYLLEVTTNKISTDDITFTVNNLEHHLSTSDLAYEYTLADIPSGSRSKIKSSSQTYQIIVPADAAEKDYIKLSAVFSDKTSSTHPAEASIKVKTLGYFSPQGALTYVPFYTPLTESADGDNIDTPLTFRHMTVNDKPKLVVFNLTQHGSPFRGNSTETYDSVFDGVNYKYYLFNKSNNVYRNFYTGEAYDIAEVYSNMFIIENIHGNGSSAEAYFNNFSQNDSATFYSGLKHNISTDLQFIGYFH